MKLLRVATPLLLFAAFLTIANAEDPPPYAGFVVAIDPGHQGQANGTQEPIGPDATETKPCVSSGTSGTLAGPEHTVNLDVGLRLHDLLTEQGVTVIMTRTTPNVDLCNSERAAIWNRAQVDLAVRLHCDAGSVSRCSMLYPVKIAGWTDDIYDESLKAAMIVQAAYVEHTGLANQGLIPRSDLSGFNWSDEPVILPEMLNMNNASDDANAADPAFRQKMAEGLANGILEYLDTLPPKPSVASDAMVVK